jgi:hypothetical protein
MITNQLLYQLSYTGEKKCGIWHTANKNNSERARFWQVMGNFKFFMDQAGFAWGRGWDCCGRQP